MNMNNGMNAAQIAQLQQQLAAQQQQQQQQNNPMMANAFMGGNPQQLQQALFQQQQQQQQQQQGMMMNQQRSSTASLGGAGAMNNMNAMLLQQQQQGGNNSNAYWNQTAGGAMDASQASGAQLAALAGMNMQAGGGNALNNNSGNGGSGNNNNTNNMMNNVMNPAHQMLLGQRSSSITSQTQNQQQMQQQHHNALLGNLGGGGGGGGANNMGQQNFQQQPQQNNQGMGGGGTGGVALGQTTDAAVLQQQIAQLQRQLQQQQQQNMQNNSQPQQQQNQMGGMSTGDNDPRMSFSMQNNNNNNQQQQQMFPQMMGNNSNNSGNMMGDGSQQGRSMSAQGAGSDRFSMLMQGGGGRQSQQGNINNMSSQQEMMLQQQQQQQQLMRSSNMSSQSMQSDAQKVQEMMRRQQQQQQQQPNFELDGSTSSQRSRRPQQQAQMAVGQPMGDGSSMGNNSSSGVGGGGNGDDANKSFLDGSFIGGWQSNADLPDRRRIIFSILEVIRQMRPDTNKISQKLPNMAKSLEEHLYRSAQTKEEYLDQSTLKKRLQLIAHGLEVHKIKSSGSVQSMGSNNSDSMSQMQQQNGNAMGNQGGISGMNQGGMMQNAGNLATNGTTSVPLQEPVNDRIAAQKKKVIRQQQQRLLLLRHASKCKLGPACTTKFCGQMTTLWKHMKKCRDKNCKVSHCLSSRCVLNHYRICKSQGRTATCEVCGPVMEQIKRQDANEALDSSDPLAAKPDQDLQSQMGDGSGLDRQMSVFGSTDVQQNAQLAQQQAMQQLYQQQQQAIQQNQQGGGIGNQMQQNLMNGMSDELSGSNPQQGTTTSGNPQQLQQLQKMQEKLRQQQQVLKQLQKQQAQLLEQQRQLQEQQQQGQQGQQFQQQHALLQQLQQRCEQQQALIQQELLMTMQGIEQQQRQQQSGGNVASGSQVMGNSSQQSHRSQNSNSSRQSQQMQPMANNQMQFQQQQFGNKLQDMPQNQNQNQTGMFSADNQMSSSVQPLSMPNSIDGQLPNPMDPLSVGTDGDGTNLANVEDQQQFPQSATASDNLDTSQPSTPNESGQDLEDGTKDQRGHSSQLQQQPQPEQNPSSVTAPDSTGLNEETGIGNAGESQGDDAENQKSSDAATNDNQTTEQNDDSAVAAPRVPRTKGAGRGGKGKRLREIADDLGEVPSMDLETAARKRAANEINRSDANEPSNKAARTDDGPAPDSETSGGNLDGSASGASNMQRGDVEQHLLMLHKGLHLTSRTITNKCLPIVQQLIDDPYGWVFRDAVDPVVFGLPDYFEVVKNPMHLLLVKKKLENAVYTDMASFERDVKLVFENAILYNGDESEVGQLASTMLGVFEKEYTKVCNVLRGSLLKISAQACILCGTEKRQLEPPVLYCSGEECGMARIKRSSTYYKDSKNQNFWCQACYGKLKKNDLIVLDDGSEIMKTGLVSAKLNILPEETFLKCHDCHGRVHKVCALGNTRKIHADTLFRCPKCVLVRRTSRVDERSLENPESANNLPRCKMSDFIEAGIHKSLDAAYSKEALDEGRSVDEIEKATGISVRVLSHVKTKHDVREEMLKRYKKHEGFPVHTKCIGLFQSIGGVDVLLFAMYVYEYGQESPAPNRRRVYVSYLDSVQYFDPPRFRSIAYKSLVIEYLRWVKKRGFMAAHLWSCPPAPGDEYVFHCHPHTQKIPDEDKLREWYRQILESAQSEGVAVEITDYWEEYFKNHGQNAPLGTAHDPSFLPYFEGDYVPGEIESVISTAKKEEEIVGKGLRRAHLKDQTHRRPTSGLRSGTRSNPGQLVNQYQDKIMNRLGNAIYNMKQNLIIARLRSKRFCAAVERGEDVTGWPDDEDYRPEMDGKDSAVLRENHDKKRPGSGEGSSDNDHSSTLDKITSGSDDKSSAIAPVIAKHFDQMSRLKGIRTIGSTTEEDEQLDNELFESRQLFLNYCRSNRCQFDELRRAKHSSMMVLYQLHNPSAPMHVQICAVCRCEISNGYRYHCKSCDDYDLCSSCYRPVTSGEWKKRGKQYTHPTFHTFAKIDVEASERSNADRSGNEERKKALQGYLEVLAHAANCGGASSGCQLNNCAKMKQLFVHVRTCNVTHSGGCKICARLLSLIVIHARTCTVQGVGCPLPYCDKIRERNERLRKQQLFMDDRRRQAQNAHYQSGA